MTRALSLALMLLAGPAAAACTPDEVELRWDGGHAGFVVEIADTEAERAQGLMHRASLPHDAGMLFVFERPQRVSFWMKNTLIPLDMLFVSADGTVERIKEMAAPEDETPIPGGTDVEFVLEINGGQAKQLGIAAGAVMRYSAIADRVAKWPCSAP